MKRLIKKAETIKQMFDVDSLEYDTRDGVFMYYDGQVLIGGKEVTHNDLLYRLFDKDMSSQYNRNDGENRDNLPMAFGHIMKYNNEKVAVIETATMFNTSVSEVAEAIKKQNSQIQHVYTCSVANKPTEELTLLSKRLVKKSFMNIEVIQGTLKQLGNNGRDILKAIEEYKFKIEQASRIMANDPMMTQKIIQKRKILDSVEAQIYGIVFDLENIDITQTYQDQQLMVNNPGLMNNAPDGEAVPTPPAPGAPGQAPANPQDKPEDKEDGDAAPAGGGPIPQGGSGKAAPKSDGAKDSDENGDDESEDKEDLKEEDLPDEEPEETK